MRNFKIAALIIAFVFLSQSSFAEENVGFMQKIKNWGKNVLIKKEAPVVEKAKAKEPAPQPKKEHTRQEMIAGVKETLGENEEILNLLPGMKMEKTDKGEASYIYNGIKLEDLENDKLKQIFMKVRRETLRIRTERINNQMETIRRSQQITSGIPQSTVSRVPPTQVAVPQVYTLPRVPTVPSSNVPQTPKVPSLPPAPPSSE